MSRSAREHIPEDVLFAAERAGLKTPIWYVGRSNGHEDAEMSESLDEIIEGPYRAARKPIPKISPKSAAVAARLKRG